MTQALQAPMGMPLLRVVSAAQRKALYRPSQTAIRAAMRSDWRNIRLKGAVRCRVKALEHYAAPEPRGDGPATASGLNQRASNA